MFVLPPHTLEEEPIIGFIFSFQITCVESDPYFFAPERLLRTSPAQAGRTATDPPWMWWKWLRNLCLYFMMRALASCPRPLEYSLSTFVGDFHSNIDTPSSYISKFTLTTSSPCKRWGLDSSVSSVETYLISLEGFYDQTTPMYGIERRKTW